MLVSKERYQGLEVEHYANIEPKAQCTEDYINVKQDELDLGMAWPWAYKKAQLLLCLGAYIFTF